MGNKLVDMMHRKLQERLGSNQSMNDLNLTFDINLLFIEEVINMHEYIVMHGHKDDEFINDNK